MSVPPEEGETRSIVLDTRQPIKVLLLQCGGRYGLFQIVPRSGQRLGSAKERERRLLGSNSKCHRSSKQEIRREVLLTVAQVNMPIVWKTKRRHKERHWKKGKKSGKSSGRHTHTHTHRGGCKWGKTNLFFRGGLGRTWKGSFQEQTQTSEAPLFLFYEVRIRSI